MNKIRIKGILMSAMLIMSLTFTVIADTQSDLNKAVNEKNKIQQNINSSKNKKAATEAEKKKIDANVDKLSDQQIGRAHV